MRPLTLGVAIAAIAITSQSVFAQSTDGIQSPGAIARRSSRFESPVQQYLTARARAESEHQVALLRSYDLAGIDYGRPQVSANAFWIVQPPMRARRFFIQQNYLFDGYSN